MRSPTSAVRSPQSAVLGIDVGGTKLAAEMVAPDGRVLSAVRTPTPTGADADGLFAAILAIAERAQQESGQAPTAIGIGCGGPMIFPDGIVSPLHIPVWAPLPCSVRLELSWARPPARQ